MLWFLIFFSICWRKYCLLFETSVYVCPPDYEQVTYKTKKIDLEPDKNNELEVYVTWQCIQDIVINVTHSTKVKITSSLTQEITVAADNTISFAQFEDSTVTIKTKMIIEDLILKHSTVRLLEESAQIKHISVYMCQYAEGSVSLAKLSNNITFVFDSQTYPWISFDKLQIGFHYRVSEVLNTFEIYLPKDLVYDILLKSFDEPLLVLSSTTAEIVNPYKISFANFTSPPFIRLQDSIYIFSKYTTKTAIESDTNENITFYTTKNSIPQFFQENPKLIIQSHTIGQYCLVCSDDFIPLCPGDAELRYYTPTDPINQPIVPDSHKSVVFYLTSTKEKEEPIVSMSIIDEMSVTFVGVRDIIPFSRYHLGLIHYGQNYIQTLILEKVSISVISVNPINVDVLFLTNSFVETRSAMIAVQSAANFDKESYPVLNMLTPINSEPKCPNRAIKLISNISVIQMSHKWICVDKTMNFSNVYASAVRLFSESNKTRIEFKSGMPKGNIELPMSLDLSGEIANVTFAYNWDNYIPIFSKPLNFPIKSKGIINFYSEIPSWPMMVFDVQPFIVYCSKGGRYCFYGQGLKCPANYHLTIPMSEFTTTFKIYAHMDSGRLDIYFEQSKEHQTPRLILSNIININYLFILGSKPIIFDVSNFNNYLSTLYFGPELVKVVSNPKNLLNVNQFSWHDSSLATFENVTIQSTTFICKTPQVSNFDFVEDPSYTSITLILNNTYNGILLTDEAVILSTKNSKISLNNEFMSISVIFSDEAWRENLFINSTASYVDVNLMIYSSVGTSINFELGIPMFYLETKSKISLARPTKGLVYIISPRNVLPDSMVFPVNSSDVIYKFAPPASPTMSKNSPAVITTGIAVGVYLFVCIFFIILLFIVGYMSITCQNSPELPTDLLMTPINTIPNNDSENYSKL